MRFRGTPLRAVVALVLFFCGYATVGVAASATAIKGGHYEPTLLQIVDPKTNELLRVTDHRSFYKAVPYELPDIIIPSSFYLRNNNPFDMTTTRNSFIAMTSDGNDDDMDDDSKKNTRIINSGGDTPHHQHQHVLQVDKTELHQVRESLTVSWQGVDNKDEDVLALYCDNEDSHGQLLLMEAATIDQVRATSIKHRVGGDRKENIAQDDDERNSWYIPNFPITRSSACTFVLYRGGGDREQTTETKKKRQYSYVPIASSPTIGILLNDIATNVHLALGDDISSMIVHFTTGSNKTCNCHRDDGTPVAMYRQVGGTNTSNANNSPLPKMVIGTTTSYQAKDMCDNPANITGPGHFYPPGQLHTIMLTDLQPNTKYKYKVRLDIAGGTSTDWSEEYTFTSPPLVGDKSDYVYVVYGDQGCPSTGWGDGGEWTSRMERQEPSLQAVHHFGDLSYARGAAHMWDEWLAITQQFATKVPLMIGVGNHVSDGVMCYVLLSSSLVHESRANSSLLRVLAFPFENRNTTTYEAVRMGRILVEFPSVMDLDHDGVIWEVILVANAPFLLLNGFECLRQGTAFFGTRTILRAFIL